jgi:hypothetical protein
MGMEHTPSSDDSERRRDARVSPQGRVRMTPPEPGLPFEGRLVDVSARGLRFACGERGPVSGAFVTLEILLQEPSRPEGPPRLVLDGQGQVVWVDAMRGEGLHAGIRFDAPVDVRQSFPGVRIY